VTGEIPFTDPFSLGLGSVDALSCFTHQNRPSSSQTPCRSDSRLLLWCGRRFSSSRRPISANLSSLKGVKPHEYALRFLFGGLCTVAAGLIAKRFGPAMGGLFLAFPAIFPAGASLLEAHEKRKMAKSGLDGTKQGREAASVDSAGASIGCIGLIAFAVTSPSAFTITTHTWSSRSLRCSGSSCQWRSG
jgi:hypothetical protein